MVEVFVTDRLLNLERLLENIGHLQGVGQYDDALRVYLRSSFERELRGLAAHGFERDCLHYVVRYAELHQVEGLR